MRLVRAVVSAGWLVLLLAGLPAALVRYVGWPLPDHLPDEVELQAWLAQPLTPTTLINTAAVAGWLVWALLTYVVVVEVLTRARRAVRALGRLRLPPLPTPVQTAAGGMLGAAVLAAPAAQAAGPPVAPPAAATPALPGTSAAATIGPLAGSPTASETWAAGAVPPTGPAEVSGPAARPPVAGPPAWGERDPAGTAVGVSLPDGSWLTRRTAQAIASAATLVWWQRRRDYQPRPPVGAARDDPDLAPLPRTVTAIGDLLYSPTDPDQPTHEPAPAAGPAEPPPTAGAAEGGTRTREAIGPGDLPPGGVGLTGPGAHAAARGLITAVLLAAGASLDDSGPRLVTAAADLDTLLGPDAAAAHRDTPGLSVADSPDEAIAVLEQQTLTRLTTNPPAYGGGTFPPVVLLTAAPTDHATAVRLAVLLFGTRLGVTGVLLGPWPHGHTWQVDPDGHTRAAHPTGLAGGDGVRLCVLTAAATVDLLTLTRQTRPGRGHPATAATPPPPATDRPTAAELLGGGVPSPSRARAAGRLAAAAVVDGVVCAPLRLRLLGAPALHRADGTPVPLQRTAAWQILTYLAVHPRGASTGELIAAVWPGPRPRGADRLYTPLSKLRAALRAAAGGGDVLVRDGDRYRLDEAQLDVDVWRLHTAVDHAAATLDPAGRRAALRAVVDTYTGELAAGKEWSWLAAPREATRRHLIDACVTLADAEPDPHTAAALLQHARRIDPVNAEVRSRARHAHTRAMASPAKDVECS